MQFFAPPWAAEGRAEMTDAVTVCTALRRALRHSVTVRCYGEIDSTNAEAKRLLLNTDCRTGIKLPLLVMADSQTAGRGRRGRFFYSPPDTGLYFSLVVRCRATETPVSVTTTAAVAAARAIENLTGRAVSVKWVNDLLLDGKKVCGILTEAINDPIEGKVTQVIVGIGVNLTTVSFPPNLADLAGSLAVDVPREALAAAITDTFLDLLPRGGDMEEYRRRSCVLGRDVSFEENGIVRFGKAVAIEADGGLTVRETDGTVRTLRTGEITLRIGGEGDGDRPTCPQKA